jgi:hypothetical protein
MRTGVNVSRLLHVTYPALVLFAALMAWSKTGYGTNAESTFHPPDFSFTHAIKFVASKAKCSKMDTLKFLRTGSRADGEATPALLGLGRSPNKTLACSENRLRQAY